MREVFLAMLPYFLLLGALSVVSAVIIPEKKRRKKKRVIPNKKHASLDRLQSRSATGRRDEFTVATLRLIEWKRFEELCTAFLRELDFVAQETKLGADGGVDIRVAKPGTNIVCCIAQCKAWNGKMVGVKEVRELFGVMSAEKIESGIFFTTATFSRDAIAFAEGKLIELFDGERLIDAIMGLSEDIRKRLCDNAFHGDYSTPTCPACGIKMVKRVSRKGNTPGTSFWGCKNFPKCRCHFAIRNVD